MVDSHFILGNFISSFEISVDPDQLTAVETSRLDQPPFGKVVLKAHTMQYRYRSAGFIFSTFSVISLE